MTRGDNQPDTTGGLKRQVSFFQLIVYGLVFIGPAAAVSVYGPLDAVSNGAVALVYLLATIAMGFTAWSYALMSRQVPRAGSVFAYVSEGIGPGTGFVAGWMIMLDYLLIPAVAYLFTGIALHSALPVLPVWGWTALAVVVTTGLNLAGVRIAARAATLVVLAECIALAMVLVAGVWFLLTVGPTRGLLTPLTGVGGFSLTAVLGAVSVALLSYLGFDAIATFAEETTGNSRVVSRALLACLVTAGLLFALQAWIGALLMPRSPHYLVTHPAQQGDAYYHMVGQQLGTWLEATLALSKAAGAAFSAMVGQAAASRILMDMGRARQLPGFLARINSHTGVPAVGVIAVAVFNVLIAVFAALQPNGLELLVSVVSMGALCAFVMLHASVLGYYRFRRRAAYCRWLPHVLAPVVGILILLVVMVEANAHAQVIAALWLLLGLIVTSVKNGRSRSART